jgi:hypothetical protein
VISKVNAKGEAVEGGHRWAAYGETTKLSDVKAQKQKDMVVAAVEAGLEEVQAAFTCNTLKQLREIGKKGYAPEQFVPKADTSAQSYIDFRWKYNTVNELVADEQTMGAIQDLISSEGQIGSLLDQSTDKIPEDGEYDTNPRAAFKSWITRLRSSTKLVIKEIADYVPGAGKHHATTDTMSRKYIEQLGSTNRLEMLTNTQMIGLINAMLEGTTGDEDEAMILAVLRAANRKGNIVTVVQGVGGFHNLEDNFQGKEWHQLLDVLKDGYFKKIDHQTRMSLVRWLVKETTREWGEEACIAILEAFNQREFTEIVNKITKSELDSFLDGSEQDRFDELLKLHNYIF